MSEATVTQLEGLTPARSGCNEPGIMTVSWEVRNKIADRMRGNTNARGKVMRRFAYRPSIHFGSKVADLIAAGNFMLPFDWHHGGRLGISTNDPERAAAWVAMARELGYAVRDAAPKPIKATNSQAPPEPWEVD